MTGSAVLNFTHYAMTFALALIIVVLIEVLVQDLSRFGLATVTVRRR